MERPAPCRKQRVLLVTEQHRFRVFREVAKGINGAHLRVHVVKALPVFTAEEVS